jgi:hypothetical protein
LAVDSGTLVGLAGNAKGTFFLLLFFLSDFFTEVKVVAKRVAKNNIQKLIHKKKFTIFLGIVTGNSKHINRKKLLGHPKCPLFIAFSRIFPLKGFKDEERQN